MTMTMTTTTTTTITTTTAAAVTTIAVTAISYSPLSSQRKLSAFKGPLWLSQEHLDNLSWSELHHNT